MSESSKGTFDYYDEAGSLLIDFGSLSKGTTLKSDDFVLINPSGQLPRPKGRGILAVFVMKKISGRGERGKRGIGREKKLKRKKPSILRLIIKRCKICGRLLLFAGKWRDCHYSCAELQYETYLRRTGAGTDKFWFGLEEKKEERK